MWDKGAYDVFTVNTDERKASVWTARGAFLEAIKASTTQFDECDVVVPRSKVIEFTECINTLSDKLGMRIPYFGHAGDGNLHVYFCRDGLNEALWQEKLNQGFETLYGKAVQLGGMVSGEHGIGYAKKDYLRQQLGSGQINLMRRIKEAFDPNGILNPQKICT